MRCRCSLTTLELNIDASGTEHDYDDDELEWDLVKEHKSLAELLQTSPQLVHLDTFYVAPPELLRTVYSGIAPCLSSARWRVTPDGLRALLDLLDVHASLPLSDSSPPKFQGKITVTCLNYLAGFDEVRARYCERYEDYRNAGLMVSVRNIYGLDLLTTAGALNGRIFRCRDPDCCT